MEEAQDSSVGAGRINKRSVPPSHLGHLYSTVRGASHSFRF